MANIRRLMICSNCDNDFELNGVGRCPSCGSTAVYPLARWFVPVVDDPNLKCIEGAHICTAKQITANTG
uniref:Uncharacterized protein n=1 Tax=viral metagenome TaxID=1070528 RepID=A0A6M3J6X3_9ZZZZ